MGTGHRRTRRRTPSVPRLRTRPADPSRPLRYRHAVCRRADGHADAAGACRGAILPRPNSRGVCLHDMGQCRPGCPLPDFREPAVRRPGDGAPIRRPATRRQRVRRPRCRARSDCARFHPPATPRPPAPVPARPSGHGVCRWRNVLTRESHLYVGGVTTKRHSVHSGFPGGRDTRPPGPGMGRPPLPRPPSACVHRDECDMAAHRRHALLGIPRRRRS